MGEGTDSAIGCFVSRGIHMTPLLAKAGGRDDKDAIFSLGPFLRKHQSGLVGTSLRFMPFSQMLAMPGHDRAA